MGARTGQENLGAHRALRDRYKDKRSQQGPIALCAIVTKTKGPEGALCSHLPEEEEETGRSDLRLLLLLT